MTELFDILLDHVRKVACPRVADLAASLGADPHDLWPLLAALADDDLAEVWNADRGADAAVTLTPRAATAAGLRLNGSSRRYVRVTTRVENASTNSARTRTIGATDLAHYIGGADDEDVSDCDPMDVADPSARHAVDIVADAEAVAVDIDKRRRRAVYQKDLPTPVIFYGVDDLWPVAGQNRGPDAPPSSPADEPFVLHDAGRDAPSPDGTAADRWRYLRRFDPLTFRVMRAFRPRTRCPSCGHLRKLPLAAYCLTCDRWGCEHLLPKRIPPPENPE